MKRVAAGGGAGGAPARAATAHGGGGRAGLRAEGGDEGVEGGRAGRPAASGEHLVARVGRQQRELRDGRLGMLRGLAQHLDQGVADALHERNVEQVGVVDEVAARTVTVGEQVQLEVEAGGPQGERERLHRQRALARVAALVVLQRERDAEHR